MRGCVDLRKFQQRVVDRGLFCPHVEPCSSNLAGADRVRQSFFVDDATASHVDHAHARLGLGEGLRTDHAGGFLSLGHVNRNEVRALKKFVEADNLNAHLAGASLGDVGVVADELHAESTRALSHETADAAQTHDAEGLLEQFSTGQGAALPFAGFE